MRVPFFKNPSCAEVGTEVFFPDINDPNHRAHTKIAISICNRCPFQTECAEWGITRERYGIWGGLNVEDRNRIRASRGITLPREEVA
jgi:hypothetical protein